MAVTADKPAPYAPPRTVLEVIARHRAKGLLPPINGELLGRIGVSDSLIPRTMQALTALDLVDEQGAPTKTFESLHLAPEADFQARMADWLNEAYADVVAIIDPRTASETEISDAFRPFKPHGQRDRMVILFKGLYAAAGVRPEAREAKPRIDGPRTTRLVPIRKIHTQPFRAAAVTMKPKGSKLMAHSGDFAGLHPMLAALLNDLPKAGEGWTKDKRDKVVNMFPTVVDFAFPIIEEPQEEWEEAE